VERKLVDLKKEVETTLRELPQERVCWFASRCALRVLPLLACNGPDFLYWKKEIGFHFFSVFRGLIAGFFVSFAGRDKVLEVTDTAVVASSADAAAYAVDASDFTSYTTVYAIANAAYAADAACAAIIAADSYSTTDAAYATDAAFAGFEAMCAADGAACSAYTAAIEADLSILKDLQSTSWLTWTPLWHQDEPQRWKDWLKTLESGLHKLGLTYWSEEFAAWRAGQFDKVRMERCLLIPESTIAAGTPAMLAYLQAETLVNLAEARVLFLGEGGAGKTSLIRCLHGEPIRAEEPATPRVEIRQQPHLIGDEEVNVHYWDFGGQVVMHATHQFFLREKSIYVVVLDIRRSDSLEYWLDHIRYFANEAPTLIVLNKTDQLPYGIVHPPFDLVRIRKRYPFVVASVYPLSCASGEGLENFSRDLHRALLANCILTKDTPPEWIKVKDALREINQDFLARAEFHRLCAKQGLALEQGDTALTVLDKLGVAIYFPQLRHTDVVLNPEWITRAIYFIIWASEHRDCQGRLSAATLKSLFQTRPSGELVQGNPFLDVEVPEDKYEFLLDLLVEFKLAFRLAADHKQCCVPMLAQVVEPPHGVSKDHCLHFTFRFPFLPPGLFFRFIAESGAELADSFLWRQGAVLQRGTSRILVEYSEYQRSIELYAHGKQSGAYLTALRERLARLIGASYPDLPVEPSIMTPEGARIDWPGLILRLQAEGEGARELTPVGAYSSLELFQKTVGQVDPSQALRDEIIWLRGVVAGMEKHPAPHVSVQVNPTISPVMKNSVQVTTNITLIIRPLYEFKNQLLKASEAVEDFKKDNPGAAVQHQSTLAQIKRQLARMHKDIEEVAVLPDDNQPAIAVQRDSILKRMKERWDDFAALAKQINDVATLGGKIGSVVQTAKPMLDQALHALSQLPLDVV